MMALMIVANEYGLNPFTKELYAYPDKQGGIVPVVSVDGWARIINSNSAMNGIAFRYAEKTETPPHGKECPIWIECTISRKDRDKPITVREYLDECYRPPFKRDDGSVTPGPWQTHTKRFLRHKTLIQCSRIAFGFGGIYDDDEAQRILEKDITPQVELIEGPKSKKAAQPDPDDQALRDLEQGTPNPPAQAAESPAGSSPAAAPAAGGTITTITNEQAFELMRLCQDNGIALELARRAWKVTEIGQLGADSYEEALGWIDRNKGKRKAK